MRPGRILFMKLEPQFTARCQNGGAFDHILQFADISGPVIGQQGINIGL